MEAMIPPQRDLFGIPPEIAWLNCAYLSPLAEPVLAAGIEGVRRKASPWLVRPEGFFGESEAARGLFARLVGGDVDGVAIVPAVSYAMAIAARNLPVAAGQRIVTVAGDFPSAIYAFRELARERGATMVTVPRPADDDWTPALVAAVTADTAIVVAPPCHWTDGTRIDLEVVGRAARRVGAAFVVDATQAAGAVPLDVGRIGADLLVAAAYKWLLGPYSLGFAWMAERLRGGRPIEHNWLNRAGSEDFARLVDYRDEFQPGARRYDVGERSNFALMPMAAAALRLLTEWRPERIAMTLARHTDRIAAEARGRGYLVARAECRSPHMVGLTRAGGLDPGLAARLAARQVFVSVRGEAVRVAPHLWTEDQDLDRLFECL